MNWKQAIFKLLQSRQPDFKNVTTLDITYSLATQFQNPIFLSPRYQKIKYSEDLLHYIKFLQRSRIVNYTHLRQFTENVLIDYYHMMKHDRPDHNILLEKNVYIPSNATCAYHGTVDWLYSANGYNMTPVLYFNGILNPLAGIAAALSNMYYRKHLKSEMEKQFKQKDKVYNHLNTYGSNNIFGYCILTTGNTWQLIRIDCNFYLEKSIILEANNQYRQMYQDENLVEVVLGMLDYCLDIPQINTQVLEKSYQYIDERRWMNQTDDKSQLEGAPILSKLLLKHYKKKF